MQSILASWELVGDHLKVHLSVVVYQPEELAVPGIGEVDKPQDVVGESTLYGD